MYQPLCIGSLSFCWSVFWKFSVFAFTQNTTFGKNPV